MDFRQISSCFPAWLAADLIGYEERCQALVEAGCNETADVGDRVEVAAPTEKELAGRSDCPVNSQRAHAAPRPGLTPCGASDHEISPARRRAPGYPRGELVVIEGGRVATTANNGPAQGRATRLRLVMVRGESAHQCTALCSA